MIVKFEGADKFNAALKRMIKKCPQEITRFLRQEAQNVKGRVMALTPVDKGVLRPAWSTKVAGNSAEIFNNTEYAPYVEFGHRVKIRGKFTGTVVPGVHMLRDGVQQSADDFAADAEKIIARIFR